MLSSNLVDKLHQNIHSEDGLLAVKYLTAKRGISPETINAYKFGWSNDDIDGDKRWERRIIYPLIDDYGSVVALSGRLITYDYSDKIGNKYILEEGTNRIIQWTSADGNEKKQYHKPKFHSSFQKSTFLYGMDIAKKHIQEANFVIIVEGQLDVASVYQSGYKNVVGLLGSALTESHISKIARYCDLAVFMFDADDGGYKALEKAKKKMKFSYDTIILPTGYDPNGFIIEHGIGPIKERIDKILSSSNMSFEEKQKMELKELLTK